ncbi:MAG TPA: hypothetical protein V6C81_19800 [Planktothrix sp.]
METQEKCQLAAVIKRIRTFSKFEKYADWWQSRQDELPAPQPREKEEQH